MNKKYAVVVGLNYPGTSAELRGCVNDAVDWTTLLHAEHYEVVALLNDAGTKEAILDQLREFTERLDWGDQLTFTFSGHGTWLPDTSGDEPDARDEALCAADLWEGGLITDDELDLIFSERAFGSHVLMLSDSCHSGSVSRFANLGTSAQKRFLHPAVFGEAEVNAHEPPVGRGVMRPPSVSSLVSGCADNEYSYDAYIRGRYNGAFTRAALDTYQREIQLGNWHEAIREILPSDYYPQTPQLTTSHYRRYDNAL